MASTNDTVTKLQEFYDTNKQKINDAYLCCSSNPCNAVIGDIENLRELILDNIEKVCDWDDSVSELLIKGMRGYISKLDTINTDFTSVWLQAENLYKSNYELLAELNKYLNILKDSVDETTLSKATTIVNTINDNISKLRELGGYTDYTPPTDPMTPPPSSPVDTYQGITIMTSSESEALAFLKKNKNSL